VRAQDLTETARLAADLPWRAPGLRPRRDAVALYRAGWLDLATRSHPLQPYAVALPLAGWAVSRAPSLGAAAVIGWGALGVVAWSLAEYALHRFLFHAEVRTAQGRILTFLAHGHHHVWPRDPRRLAATPIQLGSTVLFFVGLSKALPHPEAGHAFVAGALVGYAAYEAAHWMAHHGRPTHRWLKALQDHHLKHHHLAPTSRWGIGTPLWDHAFRTLR